MYRYYLLTTTDVVTISCLQLHGSYEDPAYHQEQEIRNAEPIVLQIGVDEEKGDGGPHSRNSGETD